MIHYPVNKDAEALHKAADELEGIFTEERPERWWVDQLDAALVKRTASVAAIRTALEDLGYSLHHEALLRVARAHKYTTRTTVLAQRSELRVRRAVAVLEVDGASRWWGRSRVRTFLAARGMELDDDVLDQVVKRRKASDLR